VLDLDLVHSGLFLPDEGFHFLESEGYHAGDPPADLPRPPSPRLGSGLYGFIEEPFVLALDGFGFLKQAIVLFLEFRLRFLLDFFELRLLFL